MKTDCLCKLTRTLEEANFFFVIVLLRNKKQFFSDKLLISKEKHIHLISLRRFRGPAVHSRHPYQFLPFGAGPRKCIGSKLALLAINRTLVKILRKFVFVRSQETEVPLTVKTASDRLTAKHGIFLKIEMVQ